MAGQSYSEYSHDLELRLTGKISQDTPAQEDPPVSPDQPCPKCNGEGYIVFRVYPWDGCSYDEKPCDLCNPNNEDFKIDY